MSEHFLVDKHHVLVPVFSGKYWFQISCYSS